jgi:hypothetical protein
MRDTHYNGQLQGSCLASLLEARPLCPAVPLSGTGLQCSQALQPCHRRSFLTFALGHVLYRKHVALPSVGPHASLGSGPTSPFTPQNKPK